MTEEKIKFIQERVSAIVNGTTATDAMYYANAVAVFGVIPMLAFVKMQQIKGNDIAAGMGMQALISMQHDQKFKDIIERNQEVFNTGKVFSLREIDVIQAAFTELGYLETYNLKNLKRDLIQIEIFLHLNTNQDNGLSARKLEKP